MMFSSIHHLVSSGVEKPALKDAGRGKPCNVFRPSARVKTLLCLGFVIVVAVVAKTSSGQSPRRTAPVTKLSGGVAGDPERHAGGLQQAIKGRTIFRYDTFGDEAFWGDTLRLHETVASLTPRDALRLGLKVDSASLPPRLRLQLRRGQVNLDDPATTLALLRLDAVVGVAGRFTPDGNTLRSIGIRCALCHSTVNNSLAPGIGRRLDGWANRDLNVGAIIAAAPDLTPFAKLLKVDQPTVRAVLKSWGPGKFDPFLVLDGKAFRPDGKSGSVLIPPAFGLAGVDLTTSTGWGSINYWNAFVGVLEMHGQGDFSDPRIDNPAQYPIGAANGLFDVEHDPDLVTPKLAPLAAYQHAIPAPRPPARSFNARQAVRGRSLFFKKAKCATCHVPPLFTEGGEALHTPAEIGIDDFQANRSPTGKYRTAPLKGLWTHMAGGFYHDGRFATLEEVILHYNGHFKLGLSARETGDLVEYLKSL
jgi:hypothetical protein